MLNQNNKVFLWIITPFISQFVIYLSLIRQIKSSKIVLGITLSMIALSPAYGVLGGSFNRIVPKSGNITGRNLTTSKWQPPVTVGEWQALRRSDYPAD